MICRSGTEPEFEVNQPWSNWSREQSYIVDRIWRPATLDELVWVVAQAEIEGMRLKAVGSGWSFEDIAVSTDWVVDISALNSLLETSVLDAATLNAEARDNDNLIHVEAGITIWDLNDALEAPAINKAIPSLGGSGGQTLAEGQHRIPVISRSNFLD